MNENIRDAINWLNEVTTNPDGWRMFYSDSETKNRAEVALILLKEQEAREQCLKTKCIICPHCDNCDVDENGLLKEQKTTFIKDGHHIMCKSCGAYWCDIDREGDRYPQNFCPNCGKVVKWDE